MPLIEDFKEFTSIEIFILLCIIYVAFRLVKWAEPKIFAEINTRLDNYEHDNFVINEQYHEVLKSLDKLTSTLNNYLVEMKVNAEKHNGLEKRVEVIEKELRKHKEGHK